MVSNFLKNALSSLGNRAKSMSKHIRKKTGPKKGKKKMRSFLGY